MISTEKPAPTRSVASGPATEHIRYMDGIRGLAAFGVMLHHITGEIASRSDAAHLPVGLRKFCGLFTTGGAHFLVAIFIVLSGYVLMLPVARSSNHEMRGGVRAYFARRFLRIVPAYYAALALSAAIILLIPKAGTGLGTTWDNSLPAFTKASIITHLLLIHNLWPQTAYRLDGPAWTVSTEWEIYFLLPLLLLPIWRRWGTPPLLATAFIVGYALEYAGHRRFSLVCPHFIFLFAVGMAAAAFNHKPSTEVGAKKAPNPSSWTNILARESGFCALLARGFNLRAWGILSTILFLIPILLNAVKPMWTFYHNEIAELFVGAGAFCFTVYALQQAEASHRSVVLRVLNSKFALWLGAFSYSLYLIHYPLIGATDALLTTYRVPTFASAAALLSLCVAVPIIAHGFYLVFEKPFLKMKERKV